MNEIHSRVSFTTPGMRTLVFENRAGAYPVNRYQSLVLAKSAYLEAMDVSFRAKKSLADMSAIEICCGGGPAALTLKASGIGFVGASDIQSESIEQVRNNAAINKLCLDSLKIGSGVTPWESAEKWIDLIACNPPCLSSALVDEKFGRFPKSATRGGAGGSELLFDILESTDQILAPQGRLIFVVTSMMNYKGIEEFLNTRFSGRWRTSPGTPVAAPYCRSDDPIADRLLSMREKEEIFVWSGGDGWIWRLNWVVALAGSVDAVDGEDACFSLYPFGYGPIAEDYLHALGMLGCPLPSRLLRKTTSPD
jgi:hypothetical protein